MFCLEKASVYLSSASPLLMSDTNLEIESLPWIKVVKRGRVEYHQHNDATEPSQI